MTAKHCNSRRRVTLLGLLTFSLVFATSALAQIKIMPLGDSITMGVTGSTDDAGFRNDLASLLDAEGVSYDFVGTQENGAGFDNDHEGHNGFFASELLAELNSYLDANLPDIVLLHIGTNDISSSHGLEATRDDIADIIDTIHSRNSNVKIILSSIIPRKNQPAKDDSTDQLNKLIEELYYNKRDIDGIRMFYAGHNEIFKSNPNWETDYYPDGSEPEVHPNDTGYNIMARVYFVALMNAINVTDVTVTDNFERDGNNEGLGIVWDADDAFQIDGNGNLENTATSGTGNWEYMATYKAQKDPNRVSMRWSASNDNSNNGMYESGLAVRLDSPSRNADGYLAWIRADNQLSVWTIENGSADDDLDQETPSAVDPPQPGDVLRVDISSDASGYHFDFYVNDVFAGRITDANKVQPATSNLYAGILSRHERKDINDIAEFSIFKRSDTEQPSQVMDLAAGDPTATTVPLTWTAVGDDGDTGTASSYDLRYSTSEITDSNFEEATQVSGVAAPSAPGTPESHTVSGLNSGTTHYFALKVKDEVGNASPLSNVVSATTVSGNVFVDDFNRSDLGSDWTADADYQIVNNQLSNTSSNTSWNELAILNVRKNPLEVSFTWADNSDVDGIDQGGFAFVFGSASATGNGYAVTKRNAANDNEIRLWELVNGEVSFPPIAKLATGNEVQPGDVVKVVISSDGNGNHFDFLINGVTDGRVTDADKLYNLDDDFWPGVALNGGFNNDLDDFTVLSTTGPPSELVKVGGDGQTGTVGEVLADTLQVKLTDDSGIPVSDAYVDFVITSGEENGASLDVPPPRDEIILEGENGDLTGTMQVGSDGNASNGKFIHMPEADGDNNQTGDAAFDFEVESSGNYYVWARVIAPHGESDSFFLQMDDAPSYPGDKWAFSPFSSSWTWYRWDKSFNLSAGSHTVRFNGREDGTKLDQVLITDDANFTPSGIETPGGAKTNSEGIASANLTLGTVTGTYTVEARFSGVTPAEFMATAVADSPATITKISGEDQSAAPGEPLPNPLVVELKDQYDNLVTDFPVNWTVITGNGTLGSPNPVNTDTTGRSENTFTMATDTARNDIQVTAPGYEGPDVIFTIFPEPGAAEKIQLVDGDDQIGTAGQPLVNPFRVLVTDVIGTPVPGISVTFKVTGGGGSFGGSDETTVTSDDDGIAAATLTLGPAPGASNTAQATASLSGSPIEFSATAAEPEELQNVTDLNLTGTVNLPLADPVEVKVLDALGNPLADFPVTFTVVEGEGKVNGKTTPQTVDTDENGIAAVEWTLGPNAGQNNNKLQASASFNNQELENSPIEFVASAQEGTAAKLVKVSGDSLSGLIQNPLPEPFVVMVTDASDNPIEGWPVTFTVIEGGGDFDGESSVTKNTNSNGEASATLTLGSTAATEENPYNNVVEASAENNGDLEGSPVTFRAAAKSTGAAKLVLVGGGDQTGAAGTALPEAVSVKVTDDSDNPIAEHPVTFKVATGGGTINGTAAEDTLEVVNSDSDGMASVTWYLGGLLGDKAQSLRISSNDGVQDLQNSPLTVQATATVGPVDPDASQITADVNRVPADGSSVANVTVTLTDKFGNPVSGKAVTIKSSGDQNFIQQPEQLTDENGQAFGSIASTKAEVKTLSARNVTDGFDVNNTTTVEFTALQADRMERARGQGQSANIGTALPDPIVVLVLDKNNNAVPGVNVEFVVTDGDGRVLNPAELPADALGKNSATITTDSQGEASAIWILGPNTGTNAAEARVDGLTGSPVTFGATGVNNPATTMVLHGGNEQENGMAGTQMTDPLQVNVTDANGMPVWNVPVTFSVTQGGGSLSNPDARTDFRGIAETNFVLGPKVGTNVVEARNGSLNGSPITFSFLSVPGTPAILKKLNGDDGSGPVDTQYRVEVIVTDINDNRIEGVPITWEIIEGDAEMISQNTLTDQNGLSGLTMRLPKTAGTVEAKASSETMPGLYVIFTINVTAGTATDIAEYDGNNQEGTIGRELVHPIKVLVTDAYGNPVSGHTVQWLVTTGDGSLDHDNTTTNAEGIAANYWTLGSQPGANTAWAVALNSQVVFDATGVTNKFPLFSGLRDTSVVEGRRLEFQVNATDEDGDPITYEAGNLPSGASFNPSTRTFSWTPGDKQAGDHQATFIARDNKGGFDSETITITVRNSNQPPTVLSFQPTSFELIWRRNQGNLLFSVDAEDGDGDQLSYTWKRNGTLVSTTSQYVLDTEAVPPATYVIDFMVTDSKDTLRLQWKIDMVVSVELATFMAELDGAKGVKIRWTTNQEIDNVGFNILRSLARDGEYELVNGDLIAHRDDGTYEFVDSEVRVGMRYYYKLEDVDIRGIRTQHGPIHIDVTAPETFELSQNYPNPFNPETKIDFELPEMERVIIKIFDVLGREVRTLVDERKQAGYHTVTWDARDNFGSKVGSGVYYYRIVAGKFSETRKMLLLK